MATVRRAVAKLGGKSLVRVERPLFTPAICAKRLEHCQRLMNDLKSAPAGRVIIFRKTCGHHTRQMSILWTTPSGRTLSPRPTVFATQTSVDREWMAMNKDYFVKTFKTFRLPLEAIIASDGGYIEYN